MLLLFLSWRPHAVQGPSTRVRYLSRGATAYRPRCPICLWFLESKRGEAVDLGSPRAAAFGTGWPKWDFLDEAGRGRLGGGSRARNAAAAISWV